MKEYRKDIEKQLKLLISQEGQASVCKKLGYDSAYISRIYNGKQNISIDNMLKIIRELEK